jgi:hypothetical protein
MNGAENCSEDAAVYAATVLLAAAVLPSHGKAA